MNLPAPADFSGTAAEENNKKHSGCTGGADMQKRTDTAEMS